jgi:phosphate/phosphite/phosphonate ABC transporter binding protein
MEKTIIGVLTCIITAFLFVFECADMAWANDTQIKIGVLAKRGIVRCIEKWTPTAEYLTTKIPDKTFMIIPLDFDGILSFVEFEKIDFILANPSIYVELENWYGVSRIATLENKRIGQFVTKLGGLIFCKADRKDIQTLNDLKGKTFMAAKQTSCGGWRAAFREFKEKGIDPYSDFKGIQFGGMHDTVVYAVRDGKVDAGTVRTDTLERMAMDGKIDVNTFRVINNKSGKYEDFPFILSTRLYPEWPFAKLKHISNELAEKVAIALLEMPANSAAAIAAKCSGWTIPLNYQPVHEGLKELRIGPYKDFGKITPSAVVKKYWAFILAIAILFAAVSGAAIFILRLNRNIRKTHIELQSEVEERRKAEEGLQESEKKLRTIIEHSNELFYLHDTEHVLTYVSPTSEEILGYTPEEMMIKWTELATDNPINQKGIEIIEKIIKTGERQKPYLIELEKKDGTFVLLEIDESPIKDANGKVVGISGAARDVTKQKQAEEERKKLEAQLQQAQKMETIGILAGGVAHDLNNILSGIVSYPELILMDLPEDSHLRKPILTIQKSGEKAAKQYYL